METSPTCKLVLLKRHEEHLCGLKRLVCTQYWAQALLHTRDPAFSLFSLRPPTHLRTVPSHLWIGIKITLGEVFTISPGEDFVPNMSHNLSDIVSGERQGLHPGSLRLVWRRKSRSETGRDSSSPRREADAHGEPGAQLTCTGCPQPSNTRAGSPVFHNHLQLLSHFCSEVRKLLSNFPMLFSFIWLKR